MEFQLLYDFLKSGKTQKAFTQEAGGSPEWVRVKILKQLRQLERTKLIDLNDYVKDKHSILAVEVRKKRDMWMRAIEAYNEAVLASKDLDLVPLDLIAQMIYQKEFNENIDNARTCWLNVKRGIRANYREKAEFLFLEWKLKQFESRYLSQ
jgi:hypothetical protein